MIEITDPFISGRYTSDIEEEEEEDYVIHGRGEEVITTSRTVHYSRIERCMFFICFIFILLLFLLVGFFTSINQSVRAPSLPLPVPTQPRNETCDPTQCRSLNCMTIATEILNDVDLQMSPCDDFYAYTCSKWEENQTIPEFQSRIDMEVIAKESIYQRLDKILTTQVQMQEQSLLADQEFMLDRQLFVKISELYQSCMNIDTIESIGLEPLFQELRNIQQLVPLGHYELTNKQLQKAITYLADQQLWTLFELRIENDIFNPSKPSLFLWSGQVGLPDPKLYDDSHTMSAYFHAITTTIQTVFGEDCSNEFGFNYWNSLTLARRIVEFERKIIETTRLGFRDPAFMERWTVAELQESLPMIEWDRLVQHFGQSVPETIFVPKGNFIAHLKRQVFGTTNPRTLQMYFIWRTLWKNVDVLGEQYALPKRQLEQYLSGVQVTKDAPLRRDVCIDMIDHSSLGLLLGRYFLKDREQEIMLARDRVKEITDLIIQIIKDKVNTSDWILDEKSKLEIISKLENIEFQIGFSDSEPNIRDTYSLTEYFKNMAIIKGDFYGNMRRSYQFESKETWKLIGRSTYDKQSWNVNAHSLKITYHQELNKVIIPAGLLQYPYFDPKGPFYLYVGTIGWMVGHEIMHGFDSLGRNYDQEGRYRKWLNDGILRKLDQKNQCLMDQYYQYGIDGRYSLNNNFADQGGVIFIELLKNAENMSSLPGLNQWNFEQLSYIQFARMKCSKTTKEEQQLRRNYAPDSLRVNIPLINSEHFSTVFNCSKGTFMNPSDLRNTCKIW